MSTAIEPVAISIEHLDHEVVCEAVRHTGERTKADYWIEMHGCAELFVCHRCFMSWRKEWQTIFDAWSFALCGHCTAKFTSMESVAKVIPL